MQCVSRACGRAAAPATLVPPPSRRAVLAPPRAGGGAGRKKRGGGDAEPAEAPPLLPPSSSPPAATLDDFGLGADSLPLRAPRQSRPALFTSSAVVATAAAVDDDLQGDDDDDDDDDDDPAVELIDPASDAWGGGGGEEDDPTVDVDFAVALARARRGLSPSGRNSIGNASNASANLINANVTNTSGLNRRARRLLARSAAAAASASFSSDEDDGELAADADGADAVPPPVPLGPDGLVRERVFLVGVGVRSEDYARRVRERREEQRQQQLRTGRRPAFALAPPPAADEEDDDAVGEGDDQNRRAGGGGGGGGGGGRANKKKKASSSSTYGVDASLDELARLADTAGLQVVGRSSQQLESPNAATYVGGGKVAEVAAAVRRLGADTVIFDDELSPAQLRNLERALNAPPPPPPSASASLGRRARAAMAGAYDDDDDDEGGESGNSTSGGGWWPATSSGDDDSDEEAAAGLAAAAADGGALGDGDGYSDSDDDEKGGGGTNGNNNSNGPPPPPLRPVAVADRTALILDIFSQRARTKEGKLQVALAQVEYQLPRVTRLWTHLDRVGGGGRVKGAGEKQLEIDRRLLRDRAALLRRELDGVRAHRAAHRARRTETPVPVVALVGYTNAGKSSLLNALVARCGHFSSNGGGGGGGPEGGGGPVSEGAGLGNVSAPPAGSLAEAHDALPFKGAVLAEDRLFATLDPTTRRVRLKPAGTEVLVTDTVGFIQKLPTSLVAAFRATLEEIAAASVLVHVVDASSDCAGAQAEAVTAVLEEVLGGREALARMPAVTAWNKSDAAADAGALRVAAAEASRGRRRQASKGPQQAGGGGGGGKGPSTTGTTAAAAAATNSGSTVVVVSAATGDGLDELLSALREQLDDGWVAIDALLPVEEAGPLISALHRGGRLAEVDWGAEGPSGLAGAAAAAAADGATRIRAAGEEEGDEAEGEPRRAWVRVVGRAPAALAGRCARMEERAMAAMGLGARNAAGVGGGGGVAADDDDDDDLESFASEEDDQDELLAEAGVGAAWR